jgi:hypothetical protein
MRQPARGLAQRQSRIERRPGKVLRRRRERPQPSLGIRFGVIARLVDLGALGCHKTDSRFFCLRQILRVLPRQVARGVISRALADTDLLVERGRT